jgi:hypothetical protein
MKWKKKKTKKKQQQQQNNRLHFSYRMTYSDLLILILIANLAETILQAKFPLCMYYIQ